jgi:hypothetical protein
MALVLFDRVKETSITAGTGTIVLANVAVTGYQLFSAVVANNSTTYYTIADQTGSNWEVGIGTYFLNNVSLARTTVLSSSNAGSLTNFTNVTHDVFITYPAETSALGGSGQAIIVNQTTASANYTIATGTNGFSVGPITTANGVSVTVSSGQRWVVI